MVGKKLSLGEKIRLAHVLTHPIRYSIVQRLQEEKTLYIAEIAKILGIDRKLVTFHLRVMEREGLVKTELKTVRSEAGNPVMARQAELTQKAKKVMKACRI